MRRCRKSGRAHFSKSERIFLAWFHGSTEEDLRFLASFETLPQITEFDPHSRDVTILDDCPWPVRWLLTRYHHKHIFCSRRTPNFRTLGQELSTYANRVHWRAWFELNGSDQPAPMVRVKDKFTPPCKEETLLPAVRAWTAELATRIATSTRRAASIARRTDVRNTLPVLYWAKQWLSSHELVPVPRDRGGGVVLVHRQTLENEKRSLLASSWYEVVHGEIPLTELRGMYCELATRAQTHERCPGLANSICRSLSLSTARCATQLICTLKDHKPAGDMTFRNVHSGTGNCWQGLGKYVAAKLDPHVQAAPHVVGSPHRFVQQVRDTKLENDDAMIRMDIKDFYMIRSPEFLAKASTAHISERAERELLHDCILFLLSWQYIRLRHDSPELWRVTQGSGMGLVHSGAVANAAFLNFIEKPTIMDPDLALAFGLKRWIRYHDDIFVIRCNAQLFSSFLATVRQRAAGYIFKVEEVSNSTVNMIGVECSVDRGRITTMAAHKSSGPVLSASSAHPAGVHRSWPAAYLRSVRSLCSTRETEQRAQAHLVNRFKSSHMFLDVHATPAKPKPRDATARCSWLVLTFHPCFANRSIQHAIRTCELVAPRHRDCLA